MINIPNCPSENVKAAVAAPGITAAFLPDVIPTYPLLQLPPSMSRHADLQLCHLKGKYFLSCPEAFEYYRERLSPYGLEVICGKSLVGSTYPGDSAYNIARIGNLAFHNTKHTDEVATAFFKKNNIKLCHINQGYSKCMTAIVSENSCITSDKGVYKALCSEGVDTLLIEPGYIDLPGFDTGFFGGCAALISENELLVTGSLTCHPSRNEIIAFLSKQGKKLIEAGNNPPSDIGSVICIA